MNEEYVLSIDLGTQGVKTAVLDYEGTVLAQGFEKNVFCSEEEGEISIRPEDLMNAVRNTTRAVLSSNGELASRIACVSVVGMMAGIIGIDDEWNPVTRYDTGLDKRCEDAIREMQQIGEKEIIRICGCPVIDAMGAKMYWWKTRRREVFSKVSKFIPVTSYVSGYIGALKASEAYVDYTHIHLTCFADVVKCQWSHELLTLFQFPEEVLPVIVSPFEVIGETSAVWERETGLPAGIPLIAGCGDTAASALGAGLVKKNMLLDVAGTASCILACTDQYMPDTEKKIIMYPKSVIPGLWTPFGFVLGGETLSWYFNQVNYDGSYTFEKLSNEAEESDKDDLVFLPYFAGRICPSDSCYSGGWFGLKFSHTRADLFRSIMVSIAFEYRLYLERIRELADALDVRQLITSAGGARSEAFCRIKADVLQLPVTVLKQKDTSHKASVIMASYARGIIDDMAKTALKMAEYDYAQTYGPDTQKEAKYREMYERYLKIIAYSGKMFHEIVF